MKWNKKMINFSNYFQQRKLFNNLSFTEKVKYVNNPENKLSKPLVLLGFVEEKAGHLFLLFPLIFFVFFNFVE